MRGDEGGKFRLSKPSLLGDNSMKLRNYWHLFTRHTSVVEPQDPVHLALKIMAHKGFRHLPIVNREREKETLGVISAQDLVDLISSTWPLLVSSRASEGPDLPSLLQNTVSTIMNDKYIAVTQEDTILDAIRRMSENDIGALPIVKQNDQSQILKEGFGRNPSLIGIITLRDIVSLMASFAPLGIQVEDNMTYDPVTLRDDDTIISAVEVMSRKKVRRLPVINSKSDGKVDGMVTNKMILRYLESVLSCGYQKLEVRPAFEQIVKTILMSPMPLIDPREDCGTAAYLMRELGTGGFAVADSRGLVGIITERDLVRRTYERKGISFFSDLLFAKPQTIHN